MSTLTIDQIGDNCESREPEGRLRIMEREAQRAIADASWRPWRRPRIRVQSRPATPEEIAELVARQVAQ